MKINTHGQKQCNTYSLTDGGVTSRRAAEMIKSTEQEAEGTNLPPSNDIVMVPNVTEPESVMFRRTSSGDIYV